MKGNLVSVNLRFNIKYKDKSDESRTMSIYHKVESYIPHIWNHVCVNIFDVVSSNAQFSNDRKPGSSVFIKTISISRSLYVDDIWIGRVPLTGKTDSILRCCSIAGSAIWLTSHRSYCSKPESIRDDPYWISRKNSLKLIELSSTNKISLG